MAQSWQSYYDQEERREMSKLIEKGICPECQDEKPSLIYDDSRQEWLCNTCGLLISNHE